MSTLFDSGPSPRARGIRVRPPGLVVPDGSIPASAGNPPLRLRDGRYQRVHPRERGESLHASMNGRRLPGPSPRARGIPHDAMLRGTLQEVHPRERGESTSTASFAFTAAGPSPRARGIPLRPARRSAGSGSIPASAGNPLGDRPRMGRAGVHPRERGESKKPPPKLADVPGPSPRARGIRAPLRRPRRRAGSIPASAGNPAVEHGAVVLPRVHPRERGESCRSCGSSWPPSGPSPRARGIHLFLGPV